METGEDSTVIQLRQSSSLVNNPPHLVESVSSKRGNTEVQIRIFEFRFCIFHCLWSPNICVLTRGVCLPTCDNDLFSLMTVITGCQPCFY